MISELLLMQGNLHFKCIPLKQSVPDTLLLLSASILNHKIKYGNITVVCAIT